MSFVNLVILLVMLGSIGQAKATDVYGCLRAGNARAPASERALRSAWLPRVSLSYRYRPRQSLPSQLGWWSSSAWPVDSFWENDAISPSSRTSSQGERHALWVALSWDWQGVALASGTQMSERSQRLEQLMRLQSALEIAGAEEPIDWRETIARVAKEQEALALFEHVCRDGANRLDD